ncbi:MAG: hypothetical protein ABII26_08750 [Pseudomonadota bacterium]
MTDSDRRWGKPRNVGTYLKEGKRILIPFIPIRHMEGECKNQEGVIIAVGEAKALVGNG